MWFSVYKLGISQIFKAKPEAMELIISEQKRWGFFCSY